MPFRRLLRFAAPFAAMTVLAGCAAPAPPPPPPPPPAAPLVTLSPKLVELASAYRRYMISTIGLTPDFADGAAVARSLQVGAAYEPNQMVRGAIAYGAVAALQDKAFVENVRVFAKDPESRRKVAYELLRDPAYAVGLGSSASAASLVIAAIGGEGQRLYDGGKAVKQSAYDIQKQPWSKADVAERPARLAMAKSLSSSAMMGDVAETARLQQASTGAATLGLAPAGSGAPPYTPMVTRALAVAALAVLGEAGDANLEQVMGLMVEPNVGMCLNASKLNLYQCLAVARPHYEDVFCLGQHVMMDTGRCMIRAAGLQEPYEPRFIPSQESINKGMPGKKPTSRKPTRRKS